MKRFIGTACGMIAGTIILGTAGIGLYIILVIAPEIRNRQALLEMRFDGIESSYHSNLSKFHEIEKEIATVPRKYRITE